MNNFLTLVFDWGNTIMVDDGQFSGKMMDWPSVQAIEGAYGTLKLLSTKYQLVLASNAEDSSTLDISRALRLVDLDYIFHQIFTPNELSAKKPDPLFFQNVVKKINHPVEKIVMIGDDYIKDIVGAKLAGLKAIWFNPSGLTSNGHLPLQDMEVRNFNELTDVISQPFLPDVQTCFGWYMELGATHTLLAHVQNVAAIAYQLALWLEQSGMVVNPLLAHRGGLTHDLSKLQEQCEKNHAVLAAEFLESKRQFKLADIARRHLIGNLISDETRPQTWEEKIVNYADKLSEGNTIVSIDDRLEALQHRYPDFAAKIKKNTPFVKALENEIITALGTKPGLLIADLKLALFNKNSHYSNGIL